MSVKKKETTSNEPTKSELEILQVLWQFGPQTARFINDYINKEKRPVIYMSTLKLMQIMMEKGLLKRDESRMTHVYSAAVEEGQTKGVLLNKVVDNLFNGSPGKLMMALLGDQQLSAEELQEVRALIDKMDQKQ